MIVQKRKRGRPRLTPEQKLERQKAKIAKLAEAKKQRKIRKKAKVMLSIIMLTRRIVIVKMITLKKRKKMSLSKFASRH